jgi:hypothetical protein
MNDVPIKVGVVTDQTGPLSVMGIADANVARMVIDDINAQGGLLGASDNCPSVFNPTQANSDGDVFGDACDCRPLDPSLWAAPGEAPITLTFLDSDTLAWTSVAAAAGPGTTYDVARGPLADLHGAQPPGDEFNGAVCLWNDAATLTSDDRAIPGAGAGFYDLVRGDNLCGAGSWGLNSSGIGRVLLACP